jgi:hypothetical protein
MRWMRPKLNLPNLFRPSTGNGRHDTIPDDIPDTERDTRAQSGIAAKQAVTVTERAPASPAHSLADLDTFLAARLLRLEVTSMSYEDAALLANARKLRLALAAASAHADPMSSDAQSFEALLGETLRGVYAWAFGALDATFLGEHVRPLPKRVVRDIMEHADAAAMHARIEPSLVGLGGVLRDVQRASHQMALTPVAKVSSS